MIFLSYEWVQLKRWVLGERKHLSLSLSLYLLWQLTPPWPKTRRQWQEFLDDQGFCERFHPFNLFPNPKLRREECQLHKPTCRPRGWRPTPLASKSGIHSMQSPKNGHIGIMHAQKWRKGFGKFRPFRIRYGHLKNLWCSGFMSH